MTLAFSVSALAADGTTTETIILLRHGEKPEKGLGQLNCQGLNRAMALPAVLAKDFAKPDAIFAPDPAQQKMDGGQLYDYVRPLATIEPTAVSLGLPVDAGFGVADVDGLRTTLEKPDYQSATVLVAWEHHQIETLARELLTAHGGAASLVPEWLGGDFDSVYIITVVRTGGVATASFEHAHEGLDGLPTSCPH